MERLEAFDDPIARARMVVRDDGHRITTETLDAIRPLTELPDGRLATPEFGRPEYLLNCDGDGRPVPSSTALESALAEFPATSPPWVRVDDDRILVLRWLAHFVGLRHRAIHLFIDHPDHPDATFVQMRSLDKYNAPGAFDMPIGGHVDGLDSFDETLRKELREELGLKLDQDLLDLRIVGRNRIDIPDHQPDYAEHEVSRIFRAAIEPEAFGRIRLQKGEVGGLALVDRGQLDRWIREHPDRLGGGLIDAWPFYSGA